jgi:hypothetical protein
MNPYSKICLLSLLIISLVFIYQATMIYLEIPLSNDPLQHKLFDKNINITGWSATHFIVFAIAGYYGHKHIICLMLIGILWELIEVMLSFVTNVPFTDINIKKSLQNNRKINNDNYNWWYGSFSDIIVNFLGLMTGKYVIRKFI